MKKNILTLIAITAILFSACKKDNNDNSSGTSGDYQPLTTGSTWSYRFTTSGLTPDDEPIVDTTVNTVTGTTKVFDGKTFRLMKAVSGTETTETYFAIVNKVYYSRTIDEDGEVEVPYLNEAAPAGQTDIVQYQEDGIQSQVKTTVVEKGISKTVLGKTYNNVIHTKVEVQTKVGNEYKTIGSTDYFIGKGVGLIYLSVSFNNEELTRSELISYNIK
jgi:hypothetical protein